MRHTIERLADTVPFRVMLFLAALGVVPVLLLGVSMTVRGSVDMLAERSQIDVGLQHVAFALLSAGGVLGFVGYLRAHAGFRNPCRHNVTATLICLTAGILATLSVTGFVVVSSIEMLQDLSGMAPLVVLAALFAAANLVWAFAGIAWMQRLMRRYAEKAGRAFDGLPVMLLFVALVLVIGATATTITL